MIQPFVLQNYPLATHAIKAQYPIKILRAMITSPGGEQAIFSKIFKTSLDKFYNRTSSTRKISYEQDGPEDKLTMAKSNAQNPHSIKATTKAHHQA
jgi:hypothetical protein